MTTSYLNVANMLKGQLVPSPATLKKQAESGDLHASTAWHGPCKELSSREVTGA
jgi:hypothetical protein